MPPDPPPLQRVFQDAAPFRAALWSVSAVQEFPFREEEWLTKAERSERAAISSLKHSLEWFAARVAIKQLLVEDGVARRPADIEVRKSAEGAPHIVIYEQDTHRYERISCSLSHSGPYVLCAYLRGRGAGLGIDIEHRTWRLFPMRRKFMNPSDRLLEKGDATGDETALWSSKEALSKLLGSGMGCGFPNLICREISAGRCELTAPGGVQCTGLYTWFGRYVMSVAFIPPRPENTPGQPRKIPLLERIRRARKLKRMKMERQKKTKRPELEKNRTMGN